MKLLCTLRVVQRSMETGASHSRRGIAMDNGDISRAVLSHLRQRVPLRHSQAGRQGHCQGHGR